MKVFPHLPGTPKDFALTVAKVRPGPWWHLSLFLACFCTTFQGLPAQPQQSEQSPPRTIETGEFEDFDELDLDDLLDVRISIAAGKVQSLEEAPAIVSVITDEGIRRLGARTLSEVMELVPGFEFIVRGTGRERISVRGFMETISGGVLVLFNGHRLNDETFGGPTAFGLDIPLYNVRKIEVIRGPGSAQFGSGAFAAVINIIPYTAADFSGTEISVGGGSYQTQEYSVIRSHTVGELGLQGSFQFSDTDGPRLPVPLDAQVPVDEFFADFGVPPASIAPGYTVDDRRIFDGSFDVVYRGFNLMGRIRDEESGGFIGSIDVLGEGNKLESKQVLLGASQVFQLNSALVSRLKFTFSRNQINQFENNRPPGTVSRLPDGGFTVFPDGVFTDTGITSRKFGGEIGLDYLISTSNQLAFGMEIERESVIDSELDVNVDPLTGSPSPSFLRMAERSSASSHRTLGIQVPALVSQPVFDTIIIATSGTLLIPEWAWSGAFPKTSTSKLSMAGPSGLPCFSNCLGRASWWATGI